MPMLLQKGSLMKTDSLIRNKAEKQKLSLEVDTFGSCLDNE